MIAGAALVVADTLIKRHEHPHRHVFSHCHGGAVHEHMVEHCHAHDHRPGAEEHTHRHPLAQLEALADGGTKNP